MSLAVGTRLGTYEILSPLGAGGMGEVYRARDLRLGREIAIKVLPAEVASSHDRLARLEREARTVAGLNHPNIVTLHSVEDEDGIRFLTMELVEGQPLSTLITVGGLPLSRFLEIAIPLTDALVAAHERGVIHRDLKPGNVMVTHEGRVKVLDFGLAKVLGADARTANATVTVTADLSEGNVIGTVPYMAPEQLRGESVDARSDLFSLGIILYEMATGRRPFASGTSAEVMSSILRDSPEPLRRVRESLPEDLDRIVNRCLEKSPRERIQSALDVRNELRRLGKLLEPGSPRERPSQRVASIAVVPFVNRSRDEGDEYFSDGLADELLNVLANVNGLRVTARSSAFAFKGKGATAAEIGRALEVDTLLEGSVRKAGNRVRISVQLVSVSDSSHLWSETYDRTLEDIFAVQDDIAQSVVTKLRTTLVGEEVGSSPSGAEREEIARATKGRGTDPEAHRLYLLSRHLIGLGTREGLAKAIGYLREGVGRDPKNALVWSQLSLAYSRQASRGWVPVMEGYRLAREAAQRVLALEPDLAEGHLRMAWIQMYHDWDFRGAESSCARALALSPSNAAVLHAMGTVAMTLGRLEEAIGLNRRALEQDPLSGVSYHTLGFALHKVGRFEEADAAYRKALELAPERTYTRANLSLNLLALGHGDEAMAEVTREPHDAIRLVALAILHHVRGHEGESNGALEKLIEHYSEDGAFQVAEVYAARGEADAAFEWLERAYSQRDPGLADTKTRPTLRSLHADPRWTALLGKIGLPI